MAYQVGDGVLLVSQYDDTGLQAVSHTVTSVAPDGDGQTVEVDGRRLTVDAEGVGDHPGVTVRPVDNVSEEQLRLGGGHSFIVEASSRDDFSIDLDDPGEDFTRRGPRRG